MKIIASNIQSIDLILAVLLIFVVTILLGYVRFCAKPLGFLSLFRENNFSVTHASRVFKYLLYGLFLFAAALYIYFVYVAGGIQPFLSGGKLLKTGASDLSYQSLVARYFSPLIFYVIITISVWITDFYRKKIFFLWILIVLGSLLALSSGSRGQLIGFLLSNVYVYIVYKFSVSTYSIQGFFLPFRVYSNQFDSVIFLSKKKIALISLGLATAVVLVVGLPYLKAIIWTLPLLSSGESFIGFSQAVLAKYAFVMKDKIATNHLSDSLILFYSAQDHQLASYLAFWTDLITPYFANHQLDFFFSIKSLIISGDSGLNTPSTYFQSVFQSHSFNEIGRIPPYFLASSLYYHTLYLYIPFLGALFYCFYSFDLFISRFREAIPDFAGKISFLKAYTFVWACICPVALFNYLFFPDWFMSIYKILPFFLFSFPMLHFFRRRMLVF